MGHLWPLLQAGLNNSQNFSMALIWGSVSLFLSDSTFRCAWTVPSTLPLSNFLPPSSFALVNSTQMGVDVIHSPCYTRRWSLKNSNSAPVSTLSSHVVLHKCRKTCTRLWTRPTRYAPKKGFPAKALSYFWSNWSMWCGHVAMAWLKRTLSTK